MSGPTVGEVIPIGVLWTLADYGLCIPPDTKLANVWVLQEGQHVVGSYSDGNTVTVARYTP